MPRQASREPAEGKPSRPSSRDLNDEIIAMLQEKPPIRNWAEWVESVALPPEFVPAFASGRPELIRLAQPRALTAEECGHLFNAFGVMLETNQALQTHSQRVADLVTTWMGGLKQLLSLADQIDHFAHFRATGEDVSEDQEP